MNEDDKMVGDIVRAGELTEDTIVISVRGNVPIELGTKVWVNVTKYE